MIRKLFDKYGCDKGRKHGYDVYYQKLFDSYDKNINILEIGVFRGDSTLATHEYLEDATIYGVDIRDIKDVAPYLTFDQGLAFPTSFSSSLDYLVDSLSVDFDNGTSTFTESALPTADMGTLPTA